MNNKFKALKLKKFVDREEFFELVEEEVAVYSNNRNSYLKIISIFGMGGIGKSRFLKELSNTLEEQNNKEFKISYLTLEIDNKNQLRSLIRIRRHINKPCYLFDYALLSLTEKNYIEKINDDFIDSLKTNIFTDLLTLIQESVGGFVPTGPSLNGTIELINEVIIKGKKQYAKGKYKDIVLLLNELIEYSPKELLDVLPNLLGVDIKHNYKNNNCKKMIFLIDSYEVYDKNWLEELIFSIGVGLYIITSREKQKWDSIDSFVCTIQMGEIPLPEARKYLYTYIPKNHKKIIEQILIATERIPIYLDLAISTMLKLNNYSEEVLNKISFKDKSDIVQKFLDHLTYEEQNTILVLSLIDIFDENIFDHLVVDLNLPISKTQYNDFCSISIIDYIDENSHLKMFHDVFHINVSKITNYNVKHKVFSSYLYFIAKRGILLYSNEDLCILFNNLIHLIQINDIFLSVKEIENFLDIFFVLYENNYNINLEDCSHSKNNILFSFLNAVKVFRKDIKQSYYYFEKIKGKESELGKHKNSFYAIYYYVKSISGKYQIADDKFISFNKLLDDSSILDWYYGKIKIYYNDLLMLKGKFKSSVVGFEEYKNEIIPYSSLKTDDIFECIKQIGHCYRFNFELTKAEKEYTELWNDYEKILPFKCYLLTALCETNCYFNSKYVIDNYQDALKLTESIGQTRSYAKILYSIGIAEIVNGKYEKAIKHINDSININNEIGYKAGSFFAMIAKSYYYYSIDRTLSPEWIFELERTVSEINVYRYLMLPVYLMIDDTDKIERIQNENEWMDWNKTITNYKRFISLL